MKKQLLVIALVAGLLLALGAGFAQPFSDNASHSVTIQIPDVLFLRITNGTDNAAVTGAIVNFDFASNPDAIIEYLDHVAEGGGWIESTDDDAAFDDVIVFSNRAGWRVTVQATAFATAGFSLANVRVTPDGTNETSATVLEDWTLAATQNIATGGLRTEGWESLGFSADAYEINLDGTELPGDYTTTVTYTIAQP